NSNAVPETQVFGHRAGLAAARHATSTRVGTRAGTRAGRVDERAVLRWAGRLSAVRDGSPDVAPELKAALAAFREAMWLGLGNVRTENGLGKALAEAEAVLDRVVDTPAQSLGDRLTA